MNEQEKFDDEEKKVLGQFQMIHKDILESIEALRNKDKRLLKSELSLAFIGADSFSRLHELINEECQKEKRSLIDSVIYRLKQLRGSKKYNNQRRLKIWFRKFVFCNDNEIFKNHKSEIDCSFKSIWDLRNSLLHFYGLPKPKKEYIVLGNLSIFKEEEFKKFVRINHKKEVKQINPYIFIDAILQGTLVQLEEMKIMIKNEPLKYIQGIRNCFEIIRQEGTIFVESGEILNK